MPFARVVSNFEIILMNAFSMQTSKHNTFTPNWQFFFLIFFWQLFFFFSFFPPASFHPVRIKLCSEESISTTSWLDNLYNALWCCSKHLLWRILKSCCASPPTPPPFFEISLSFKNFFRARSDPAAVPAAAAVKRILKGYLSWLEEWNFRP